MMLELPMSQINFHGPKDVRAIEVLLYIHVVFEVEYLIYVFVVFHNSDVLFYMTVKCGGESLLCVSFGISLEGYTVYASVSSTCSFVHSVSEWNRWKSHSRHAVRLHHFMSFHNYTFGSSSSLIVQIWTTVLLSNEICEMFSCICKFGETFIIIIIGLWLTCRYRDSIYISGPFQVASLLHAWQISHQISRCIYQEDR